MIKFLVFLVLLAGLAFGFSTLADTEGHVLLQFGDTEYRVTLVTGLVALLALTALLMVLWTVLRLIFRLPSLIGLANRVRRQAKGQQAIARGLIAVGSGDSRLALRHAQESRRLLGQEPLALLLSAQAAQLSGDRKSAEDAFRAMAERADTQSLGLRGLFIEAERRNDSAAALGYADEALRRAPDSPWANDAMLGFRAAAGDWRGAIALVDQAISRRLVDREEGRRRRAVLLAAAALQAQESNPDDALSLALESLRMTPGLVPSATVAARRLAARGDYAKATRILEAAWKEAPHPDLAEAYLGVRQGDSALDRLKRARTLAKLMPHARESRFAVARAALDAREYAAAREALDRLVLEKPSVRACLLMAELEEVESGNQGLVRSWLARASRAPRDPAWVADGVVSDDWAPVAPLSGRIGGWEWREPPQALETHVRARIDADRFEQQADAPAIVPVEILPAVAPEPPSSTVAEPVVAGQDKPGPAPEESATAPAEAEPQPFRPIVPDDPGPEPGEPPRRQGFRLFGN
ncbi:heme biosynthesis HemY N-terminal domain-containing protein [Rhabdaerophilum sp. SD176]|uniref:heme biosynthesis protein HemY n=1 Tax=Rhabdaerophilum sp. SD176 TaxID=2983548 RepID=UPI0024DF50C1|nr:heme biosynthesis HemY N-terminal domain-containing protein [Rhabdaerophilum sp. SD176]